MKSMKIKQLESWVQNWIQRARNRFGRHILRSTRTKPGATASGEHEYASCVNAALDQLAEWVQQGNRVAFEAGLWKYSSEIRYYLHSFTLEGAPPDMLPRYVDDALHRFLRTLTLLPMKPNLRVLELGGNPWLFSILAERFFDYNVSYTNFFDHNIFNTEIGNGQNIIESAEFDEKYVFQYKTFNMELCGYPYSEDEFDIVLSCEILEHLILDPLSTFTRIKRVLKPGGQLILTTPNAVRITNLGAMLIGKNFFDLYHPQTDAVYGRHNREYTIGEIQKLLDETGYRIMSLFTEDRHNYDVVDFSSVSYEGIHKILYKKKELLELLRHAGGDLAHRGDNIYAVGEKQS